MYVISTSCVLVLLIYIVEHAEMHYFVSLHLVVDHVVVLLVFVIVEVDHLLAFVLPRQSFSDFSLPRQSFSNFSLPLWQNFSNFSLPR